MTDVAQDYAGLSLYMDRAELGRLLGEGDLANGVELLVASDRRADFYRQVTRAPMIVGVASRGDTVASYRTTVMQVLTVEMTFFAGFAAAIAFGVAFNVSRIALADLDSEGGAFHDDNAGVHHFGFDRLELADTLAGIGFTDIDAVTAAVIEKPTQCCSVRSFPVFLMTARKP